MDRPIPEEHEGLLKSALKLNQEKDLPEEVVELYWEVNRTARRIGQPVSGNLLIVICLLLNRGTPPDPVSFLDEDVTPGSRVLALHREQWHWGVYQYTKGTDVYVQLDDDTAEIRAFGPTLVRKPSRAELKLIGE